MSEPTEGTQWLIGATSNTIHAAKEPMWTVAAWKLRTAATRCGMAATWYGIPGNNPDGWTRCRGCQPHFAEQDQDTLS